MSNTIKAAEPEVSQRVDDDGMAQRIAAAVADTLFGERGRRAFRRRPLAGLMRRDVVAAQTGARVRTPTGGTESTRPASELRKCETSSTDNDSRDDASVMRPTLFGKRWTIRDSGHWASFHRASDKEHPAWRFSAQGGGEVVRA